MHQNYKTLNQKYYIAVVSKDHTKLWIDGWFMQVCHWKQAPLKRMKKDDWMIVYSPKYSMNWDEKCQSFTAIWKAIDDNVYQFSMSEIFHPFRRNIEFYESDEVSILPLINSLDFILDKKRWWYPFRFGFFEITEKDFNLIFTKMIKNENIWNNI